METQSIRIEKWKVQSWILAAFIAGMILGALFRGRAYAVNNNKTTMLSPLPTAITAEETQYSERPMPQGNRTNLSIPTIPSVIRGKASWYGNADSECLGCSPDRITASGRQFNEMEFTAACAKRFSLGQTLEVRYQQKVVRVTCTDRGGFEEGYGRILDLSKASFAELAPLGKGVIDVEVME